ncbi:MAG: M43 family zinc metalloprotease [Bacteroidia bacterium]|jgi:hypothetical protein
MNKNYALLFCLLIAYTSMLAQHMHRCGMDVYQQLRSQQDPDYLSRQEEMYRAVETYVRNHAGSRSDETFRIPVVFHVVYGNDEQNVSDEKLLEQLDILNRDYGRLNEDTVNTRPEFQPVASSTGIEFFLAEWDPQGNPTNGITRTQTDVGSFWLSMTDMKTTSAGGIDAWDVNHYLNIWVCNMAIPFLNVPFILGFATPPEGAPNWPAGSGAEQPQYDGVVLHYQIVGSIDAPDETFATISKGRTATHEVGHYLGLRHIWGDGDCSADDGLADTPTAGEAQQQTCDYTSNTCNDGPADLPDQIENYMDYTDENCMNMFTKEQTTAMRFIVENFRNDLLLGTKNAPGVPTTKARMFPNPVEDYARIQLEGKDVPTGISIYSMDQRLIKKMPYSEMLDLSDLERGLYFILVDYTNHKGFTRFSKK